MANLQVSLVLGVSERIVHCLALAGHQLVRSMAAERNEDQDTAIQRQLNDMMYVRPADGVD